MAGDSIFGDNLIQDMGWLRRPACMAKSLSMDLRERLISAVAGGMSRRSAARFFSVAPSTAIKWVDQKRRTGSVRPRARGGDYRSHHLEPHADEIVSLAKDSDLSLAELVDYVWQTHGLKVAPSTIWRLLDRHDMTYPPAAASRRRSGPTCRIFEASLLQTGTSKKNRTRRRTATA